MANLSGGGQPPIDRKCDDDTDIQMDTRVNEEDDDEVILDKKEEKSEIEGKTADGAKMHPMHTFMLNKKFKLSSFEGYVHKLELPAIQQQLQSDDINDVLTYICPAEKQKLNSNPWQCINNDHQFWANKQKAMVALDFDEWIRNAKHDATQKLQYFALLALDEAVIISWSAHNVYSEWEEKS